MDTCEGIERWKQDFDKHLNSVKNEGTGDQDNGENDYLSAAEDENDALQKLKVVKVAIHQL